MGTTQSPFCLLLMQDAAPGLPYYTASAGHLQMPSFVIAYAITRNRRMRSPFCKYIFFHITLEQCRLIKFHCAARCKPFSSRNI